MLMLLESMSILLVCVSEKPGRSINCVRRGAELMVWISSMVFD